MGFFEKNTSDMDGIRKGVKKDAKDRKKEGRKVPRHEREREVIARTQGRSNW